MKHGKKVFVIPTKSFVKIGITKYFVTTKYLVLSTKRLVAEAKFLVAATKNLFVVPNFVAVTKPFSPVKYENFSYYSLVKFDHFTFTVNNALNVAPHRTAKNFPHRHTPNFLERLTDAM